MLHVLLWWKHYHAVFLLCLLRSSEGLNLAASFRVPTESVSHLEQLESPSSASDHTPFLESSEIRTSLTNPSLATQSLEIFTGVKSLKYVAISSSLTNLNIMDSSREDLLPSDSQTLSNILLNFSSSENPNISESYLTEILPSSAHESTIAESSYNASDFSSNSSILYGPDLETEKVDDSDSFSNFHTPLMSLLVATPSSSWKIAEPTLTSSHQLSSPAQSLTTSSSNNEISNPNHVPVPTEVEHKKLLMLVLRADDCARFSKSDFEKMLSKLMAKFGFNDVIPEVSNAKCYSHLNINVTVGGPTPTLRFLPNMDGKNNFTVDVLNRTFRIVKLEKVDFKLEKTKSSNVTSSIITAVAKHESVAYIAVGVSFGLILVICVSVCCIKCCCLRKPQKRYGVPKGTHVRLRPEDYTLTPIPRPTSLYVDYYRGSGTADIYSTTSAGSIASTTPTVEQGVVQPFDTSIVPLEDSSNLPLDSSRDPSVESVPVQSDLKTFNIHSLSGKGFRAASTDSKEQLHPKAHPRRVEIKPGGVANPTFQRY